MNVALPPIGFWSYSRDDDRRARGRLSQLRALLSEELETRFGRRAGVLLFQDVTAIEYGDLWEQKIAEALDQCSFMIPILTPDFLQSEWCCKEVIRFQQREAALGRSGLIFPIHWVDTARVDPNHKNQVHDKAVWERMRATQRVQLHHLRLEEPEKSRDVQRVLHALADRIEAALRGASTVEAPEAADTPAPAASAPPATPAPPRPQAASPPGTVRRDRPDFPEMVLIAPGRFMMGIPEAESQREGTEEYDKNARPMHEVLIAAPFWMARHPVTRGQFAAFVAATGHDTGDRAWSWEADTDGTWTAAERSGRNWRNPGFAQTDDHPVVCVNHADALAYIAWLNRVTGGTYRLPSEAEWEYAARAGATTARFWGDGMDQAHHYANAADQSLKRAAGKAAEGWVVSDGDDGFPFTAPVGSFRPNMFGLHDMLGNIWKWCADPWHDSYEGAPTDGSVWTTEGSDVRRVLRGGSWFNNPRYLRAGVRYDIDAGFRIDDAGFRLSRTSF